MFGFFKRKRKGREPFEAFLMERTLQDVTLNLEDALNEYIRLHGLAVRHSLDEPKRITTVRTKVQIINEWIATNPELRNDKQLQDYVESLRGILSMLDLASPEVLKRMGERER